MEALVIFDNVLFRTTEFSSDGETNSPASCRTVCRISQTVCGGCKVGVGDVLIGTAAAAADYNRELPEPPMLKDKLIETF